MVLDIDPSSGTALYVQIRNGIERLIRSGLMAPRSRLPPSRELAISLGVSRNTVTSAYDELEADGLVSSQVGRGTYVCADLPGRTPDGVAPALSQEVLEALLADSWRKPHASLLTALGQIPDPEAGTAAISFVSGQPDPKLLPLQEFRESALASFRRFGAELLGVGSASGFAPLLDYLPAYLAQRGVLCRPADLMIAGGVQQGLSLIARIFLDPGDTVLLENLTYPGALAVFRSIPATCVGIPMDADGMRVDVLENVLKRRSAKLLYTIPTFHNPTGATLPADRRKRVLELCREHGVLIVEDDYAHELSFDGRETLPLKAWDDWGGTIYLGSFSESVCPGIRLCWILAPRPIIERLHMLKQVSDLSTSPILQGALLEFCRRGHLARLLKRKRRVYGARRDAMARAMQRHLPAQASWIKASGGLYQWVDLPSCLDAMDLLAQTRKRGVLFAPDRVFSVEEWSRGGIRLGFADVPEDRIEEGIGILGQAMKAGLRRPGIEPAAGRRHHSGEV